ncbi:hypothetical protein DL771_002642 [Monosporascus sp. 5C6A]|nr:hypothetical protein DL771_002642 [Monosporascus sp. 5C6A]
MLGRLASAGCEIHSFTTCDDGIVHCSAGSSTDAVAAETTSALPTTTETVAAETTSALPTTTDAVAAETTSALSTTTSSLLSTQVTGSSTPPTTRPASLSTTIPPGVNGTLTTSSTVAQSTPTGNAGCYLRGSLKAVGGAAIGVIALA